MPDSGGKSSGTAAATKYEVKGDIKVELMAGTTRTLYAKWKKTSYKNQDGYKVVWQYGTGQGVWFNGSESTTSATNDTYSVPENAKKVKFKVKPNPNSDAKWTGTYRSVVYKDGFPEDESGSGGGGSGGQDSNAPAAPSSVSIKIDGTAAEATVIATVSNYNDSKSTGVLRIEIVEDDARVVQAGDVKSAYGTAELTWSGTNLHGKKYKARAMAYGNAGENSEWSNYTENQEVSDNPVPSAPSNITLEATTKSVTVTVANYSDELSNGQIGIQIVENDTSIVHDVVVTNNLGVATTTWNGGNLRNKRYKARAMAYGTNGENSQWSSYTANSYVPENTTPAPPDNVSIAIDGKTVTATVLNYNDEYSNGVVRIQIVENDGGVIQEGDVKIAYNIAKLVYTMPEITGKRYKARAMGYGKDGEESPWSEFTANQYSPPAKPTNLTLVATSGTSVTVRWKGASGADSYTLEYTSTVVDGQPVFDTASSDVQQVSGIVTTYYPAQGLTTAKRWYFRVKAVNNGGDSDWSTVVNIMLGTTPDKPTIWSYTTVGRVGTPIVLNWVHSSEDESLQSGARVGIRINDGAEATINLTTESTYTYSTSSLHDGDKIRWRVSTRGIQGITKEWSDYSEYREIVVYAPPSLNFSVGYPDSDERYPVVRQFPISITGSSAPSSQTPVAFHISILAESQYDIAQDDGIQVHVNAGQEVYSTYIPTDTHTLNLQLNPGDIYLEQGVSYTVTGTVAMTNGLTAEHTKHFTAKWYDTIWQPDAEVTVDKTTFIAYIRPFCVDAWGFEIRQGFTMSIYRIDYDGGLTRIAAGLDPAQNLTVTDLHPALDYARYRIVAIDNMTGQVFFNDLEGMPVGARCAVLQWEGEARAVYMDTDDVDDVVNDWCGTILRLPYNLDVADDISPDVSLVNYIGRKHPVSYYGTQQGQTSRWNAEIPASDVESIAKLRALAIYPGDVYVREPSGSGYWANVKVSYNINHNKPTVPVSLTISRVEGGA